MPALRARDDSPGPFDPKNDSFGIHIAGIVVIVVLVLGIAVYLSVRYIRRRNAPPAESEAQSPPVSHSMSSLSSSQNEKNESTSTLRIKAESELDAFSREQLTRSIILPSIPGQRPQRQSRQEIMDFYSQSGTLPRSFHTNGSSGSSRSSIVPSSPNGSLNSLVPNTPTSAVPTRSSMLNPNAPRHSFISAHSIGSRYSVMSGYSTSPSSTGGSISGVSRKVRQIFDPVLPDELLVRIGEPVTLVQSFDDGWCVVGREGGSLAQQTSMFRPADGPAMEMGVVPAWVFVKPIKGLRAERPIRSTSLGITVQLDAPGFSSREECISWSNF